MDLKRVHKLYDMIFDDQLWLREAAKLGANPILVGYDLVKFFNNENTHINLALVSMDSTGRLFETMSLLEHLRKYQNYNEETAEYFIDGITLNIWEYLRKADHSQVTSFDTLFRQDGPDLRTAVLYYENGAGILQTMVLKNHKMPWSRSYDFNLSRCKNTSDKNVTLRWSFREQSNPDPVYDPDHSGELVPDGVIGKITDSEIAQKLLATLRKERLVIQKLRG